MKINNNKSLRNYRLGEVLGNKVMEGEGEPSGQHLLSGGGGGPQDGLLLAALDLLTDVVTQESKHDVGGVANLGAKPNHKERSGVLAVSQLKVGLLLHRLEEDDRKLLLDQEPLERLELLQGLRLRGEVNRGWGGQGVV